VISGGRIVSTPPDTGTVPVPPACRRVPPPDWGPLEIDPAAAFFRLAVAWILICSFAAPCAADVRHPLKKKVRGLSGAVVRSREYVVRRRKGRTLEEFRGDVYYRQEDREIRADQAEMDHGSGLWHASGNVRASKRLKDGSVVNVSGAKAEHDAAEDRGSLRGAGPESFVTYRYLSPASETASVSATLADPLPPEWTLRERGTAREAQWDKAASEARLIGDVHVAGQDGEIWCGRAAWNDATSALTLRDGAHIVRPDMESWSGQAVYHRDTGKVFLAERRPVLTHDDAHARIAIQGDAIDADKGSERLDADGRVVGWVWLKKK